MLPDSIASARSALQSELAKLNSAIKALETALAAIDAMGLPDPTGPIAPVALPSHSKPKASKPSAPPQTPPAQPSATKPSEVGPHEIPDYVQESLKAQLRSTWQGHRKLAKGADSVAPDLAKRYLDELVKGGIAESQRNGAHTNYRLKRGLTQPQQTPPASQPEPQTPASPTELQPPAVQRHPAAIKQDGLQGCILNSLYNFNALGPPDCVRLDVLAEDIDHSEETISNAIESMPAFVTKRGRYVWLEDKGKEQIEALSAEPQ